MKLDGLIKAARGAEKAGRFAEAQQAYLAVLTAFPGNARARAALAKLDRRLAPHYAAASPPGPELARLVALIEAGEHAAALARIEGLLPAFPGAFFLHNLAGAALEALGEAARAADAYAAALALKPDYADAHYNLGNALAALGQPGEAELAYERAIALQPAQDRALRNLGKLLADWQRHERAAEVFARAAGVAPGEVDAWIGLGNARLALRQHPDAAAAFRRALDLEPDNDWIRSLMLYQEAMGCDWRALPDAAMLERIGLGAQPVAPFGLLGFDDDPVRQRARAERYAAQTFPEVPEPLPAQPGAAEGRIRIGYVGADFHDHPVMRLLAGLLRAHDRARFEVIAYSYGPDKDDDLRRLAQGSVDRFVDLNGMDDAAAVSRVREDAIDVAIHLNGYTGAGRTPLFARRLAPVQVNFLGYPGTLGAPFMDYIVADRVVIPPEEARAAASEAVIWLPHCFQPNDDRRAIADRPMTRAEFGLPDGAFVFASFNNAYKIKPAEWDVWMRLLLAVPGSVLWMPQSNPDARANLAREAAARGVEPARLIFAARTSYAEHLARQRLADLFLDTFAYNAHTTASDALWAGLPIVTKIGRSYPARVAASLLMTMGLGELVTTSVAEYEALALALAQDPERLQALRTRLAQRRTTSPLFDTAGYTRAFEAGLTEAVRRYRAGLPPSDIALG